MSAPSSFRAGFAASLPITLSYFPIGISFGVAATRAGFSLLEAVYFSAAIYAGASQLLALTLIGGGAPVIVSALSVIAVNLRLMLYGPALLEKAGPRASRRFAPFWSFGLADGSFGAALVALTQGKASFSERFMGGVTLGPYVSWVAGTAAGGAIGGGALAAYPAIDAGLSFLIPALFLAMLLPLISKPQVPVILTSIVVAVLLCVFVSDTVGIIGGMIAGCLVSLLRLEERIAS